MPTTATQTAAPQQGYVAYAGPSVLQPGTAIRYTVTGFKRSSKNPKTGDMVQAWATVTQEAPQAVVGTKAEGAVCGTGTHACPHSGQRQGSCYVATFQAPRATWQAATTGRYSGSLQALLEALQGRLLRHGAYGDPTAIPWLTFKAMCHAAKGWTAYTHQHAQARFARFKAYAMASCDSAAEAAEAQGRGWRTFRVLRAGETLQPGEILCPASEEAGHRTECAKCLLCNGARPGRDGQADRRANIAIYAHGAKARNLRRA